MNKREQTLLAVVGGFVVLVVGYYLVNSFFIKPVRQADDNIAAVQKSISEKEALLNKRNRMIGQWRSFATKSLSDDPEKATLLLNERVTALAAVLQDVTRKPVPVAKKKVSSVDVFYPVAINLSGKGELSQIVYFLELCSREPYNLKVTGFTLRPEGKGDILSFSNCRIETIVPCPPVIKSALPSSRPAPPKGEPGEDLLESQYPMIAQRNIFKPFAPPPPPVAVKPVQQTPSVQPIQPSRPIERSQPVMITGANTSGQPGDVVGTTVLGNVSGTYVRNQSGIGWYKVNDTLDNRMKVNFVHALGIILEDEKGKIFYVETGKNINQSQPLTPEVLPELYQAYKGQIKSGLLK